VHAAVAFSYVTVRIFEGSNLFGELERSIVLEWAIEDDEVDDRGAGASKKARAA
jgi:hypothetical protein